MHILAIRVLFSSAVVMSVACRDDISSAKTEPHVGSKVAAVGVEQIGPPDDLRAPPTDASRTASGTLYKPRVTNPAGALAQRNDTVLIEYTGWLQRTGTTFFTTRGRNQPVAIDLAHASPGFSEVLARLHKGEAATLWIPSSKDAPEATVYEVALVDVISQPVSAKRDAM